MKISLSLVLLVLPLAFSTPLSPSTRDPALANSKRDDSPTLPLPRPGSEIAERDPVVRGLEERGDRLPEHKHCERLKCDKGRLAVIVKKNGTHLGFVSKTFYPAFSGATTYIQDTYTIGPESDALLVTLPSTHFSVLSHVFNVATKSHEPDHAHPWFGAGLIDDEIRTGGSGWALLTGTTKGTTPAPASLSTSFGALGESKIWTLDCEHHHLHPEWVNNDGSRFAAKLFYLLKGNGNSNGGDGLGIFGDPSFGNTNLIGFVEIEIKFIPSP